MVPAWLVLLLFGASGCKSDPVDGSVLYRSACARCHGEDGRGGLQTQPGTAPPRDLGSPTWQEGVTDDQLREVLRRGRGQMPAFEGTLSPSKIDAVVAHLRTLRRPASK